MTFTASPHWLRNVLPSTSPLERSALRGEAFSSHAVKTDRSPPTRVQPPVARTSFDRFELDESEARLTCAGEPVALAPKPFAVLCTLVRAGGKLVTKSALRDLVWGHRFVTDAVLKSTISEVRAALADDAKQPRFIETVWRHGYRFIGAAVSSCTQSSPVVDRKDSGEPDDAALATLMALCFGDTALADLIRAVAATLEREQDADRRVIQQSSLTEKY